MDSDRERLRKNLLDAIGKEGADRMRTNCCSAVAEALASSGRVLWVGSWILRNKPAEALAIVTEIAAELALGSIRLYSANLWYAGSALVRQLIEAEYLLGLFAREPGAAERWLHSSPDEIRRSFRPAQLRKHCADQFRDQEYWRHCEIGGHPTPKARLVLADHSTPIGSQLWLWVDLTQHLARLWASFHQCSRLFGVDDALDESLVARASEAISNWQGFEEPELLILSVPGTS